MIISGVHGSEYYGVDVVRKLKKNLDTMKIAKFKWKLLIVPELFPDNIEKGLDSTKRFVINWGRKSCDTCNGTNNNCIHCVDPNRQMPANKIFDTNYLLTPLKDTIEMENRYLLTITQKFNPHRILSVHCKNEEKKEQIGIYVDPRVDEAGIALNNLEGAGMAINMAFIVKENGGRILGNFVDEKDTIISVKYIYPKDPKAVYKGSKQERSFETDDNKNQYTYGTWASTEIKKDGILIKQAANIFTVEMPQFYSFYEGEKPNKVLNTIKLKRNTDAYLKAFKEVFLEIK